MQKESIPLGVQPLNYSTHAADFFMAQSKGDDAISGFQRLLAKTLKNSIKFLLPPDGKLFEREIADYDPKLFDLIRMPYSMCALEFVATDMLYDQTMNLERSPKRIALCFDPNAIDEDHRREWEYFIPAMKNGPTNCFCMIPVFSDDDDNWRYSSGLVMLDLDGEPPKKVTKEDQAIHPMGGRKPTKHGLHTIFLPFYPPGVNYPPELKEMVIRDIHTNSIDELRAAYEFLSAINCSNIDTITIPASSALNKKRVKSGKTPFSDYKMLNLMLNEPKRVSASSRDGQGNHASPRTHLRRGHPRRLGEKSGNKVIWVSAAMVNASKYDSASDTYQVKAH